MDGRSASPGCGDHAAQMVNMKGMAKAAGTGLLVLTMLTALAQSQERTLWKIGSFDKSSGRFQKARVLTTQIRKVISYLWWVKATIGTGIAFSQDPPMA